jgi:hypothetical protein
VAAVGLVGKAVTLPAGAVDTGCAVVTIVVGVCVAEPGVLGAGGMVGDTAIGETVRSNGSSECRWKIDCATSSLDKVQICLMRCRNFGGCCSSGVDESSCPTESPRSKSSTKQRNPGKFMFPQNNPLSLLIQIGQCKSTYISPNSVASMNLWFWVFVAEM